MTSILNNRLRKILKEKGYPTRGKNFIMSDEFLKDIGLTAYRFNRIVDNEVDMTVTEQRTIAKMLGLEPEELYNSPEEEETENFGIKFTSPK
jgi:hypothetical protein